MLEKIKGAISKKAKRIAAAVTGALSTVSVLAVAASASEAESSSLESIVQTAGTTLKSEFVTLVSAVVPVAIGIGVVGLGLYACIYLFKVAKKYFGQAAS